MTLEEKIDYIGGDRRFYIRAIPQLQVPELKMADGPLGVRNYGPSTAYPAGIALAASWDTDLVRRVGVMMGKDSRARGVHFLLGPGMNIYRAPMNGRNFEYFGEDPFLASRMAVADIQGIQSQGVIATAKHYMGNNQEWDRHRISSDIDERTMREIYLPAFEASVKEAKVGAIMDSYNLINGVHATQNGYLNTDILRKEWGFTGIVMSDWDATYDGVAAANGGLDLEMPSGRLMNRQTLLAAVQAGKVSEATIDEKVRRILRTALEFGFFDHAQTDASIPANNPDSQKVALEAALGSMVLLKNNGLLPLDKSKMKSVAVIGPTAMVAVTGGGGSSKVKPFAAVSLLDGIKSYLGNDVKVAFAPGVGAVSEAKEAAASADAVVICVGFDATNEGEGYDRGFALPKGQDELIKEVLTANKNVIVVITAGGAVDMSHWVESTPALLHAWFPGQEGGTALARILFGDANPSGKLPASFERRWEDNATFNSYSDSTLPPPKGADGRDRSGEARGHIAYKEGLFLGYRHFDKTGIAPLFPFGYGLSYTTFKYGNLKLTRSAKGNEPVTVTFDIRNSGKREGAEVAQVYVSDKHSKVVRPVKELKGFAKVNLKPGESKTVTVLLDRRAFSYYDVGSKQWKADPGAFAILVGSSAAKIELTGEMRLTN
jgi:beta-glucosidase